MVNSFVTFASSQLQALNFQILTISIFGSNFGQVLVNLPPNVQRFQAFLFSPQKWSKIEEEEKSCIFQPISFLFFQRFFKNSLVGVAGFFSMKTVPMMRAIHLWAFWTFLRAFWVVFGDVSKIFPTFFYSIQHLS